MTQKRGTDAQTGQEATTNKEENNTAAKGFPIIAIGASAGGVEVLKKFFNAMPAQSGIAFVVIVHLDPTHISYLPELLSQQTTMPVTQAQDAEPVLPGYVYLIPPNKSMTILKGCLHLAAAVARPRIPMPIDHFLYSLAADQQECAVAIILSGAGSDGALGIRKIKATGGLVMAQQPDTAAYDSMPASAIATGLVDKVLPVEAMPEALLDYIEHTGLGDNAPFSADVQPEQLHELLALLRAHGGHDFRCYKKSMVLRRIQRRMGLNHITSLEAYTQHLRDTPAELQTLAQDLLISVTAFFREPEAWGVLATEIMPTLLAAKPAEAPIRVWVAGCATGEEAYSIGMLLLEQLDAHPRHGKVQIFATDIDQQALDAARTGCYPNSISSSLTPARLTRFFTRIGGGYQVKKELREIITFAAQNLVTDAPFSRLDLISCRNLLIYLEPELQRKVISLFHFSLNPGGHLLLGKSETIGSQRGLFDLVSKRWRIYRRSGAVRQGHVDFPLMAGYRTGASDHWPAARPRYSNRGYGEFVSGLLLQRYAPATVLINRDYQILYFYGPTDDYLAHPTGDISDGLLGMAREGLRLKLRAALHRAVSEGQETSVSAEVVRGGVARPVIISVTPVEEPKQATPYLLVMFQPTALEPISEQTAGLREEPDSAQHLENELASTKRELESAIRELETSNEELKVANEEAMSVNEELQSSNEELETSKEELQSLNEELTTVNLQLEEKITELEGSNNDLGNLLSSTNVATLFLDRSFHIKRFTPASTRLFKLIPSDSNRLITDIASQCLDNSMISAAQQVLETLMPDEREVQTEAGEWYLRRILPYRTQDDRIEGVVVTFADITTLKQAALDMQRFAAVMRDSNDAIILFDFDGRIMAWNRGAEKLYGYGEAEALKLGVDKLAPAHLAAAQHELIEQIRNGAAVQPHEAQRLTRDGRVVDVWFTVSALHDDNGVPVAVAATERDISQLEASLREHAEALQQASQRKDEFLATLAHELRNPLAPVLNAAQLLERKGGEDPQLVHWASTMIKRQTGYLARMVNDLLDVARISQGRIDLLKVPIDLSEIITQAVEAIRPRSDERKLTLDLALPTEPVRVEADAARITQVLDNLLDNAIKYTPEGGSIEISVTAENSLAVCRVRDSGEGMDSAMLPLLFDLFAQADRTLDRAKGGLGIGLSLVKRLVELHGGQVEASSAGENQGSEFVVRLPLLVTEAIPSQAGESATPPAASASRRILVVDDNPDVAHSFAMLLEIIGHQVMIAPDGPTALGMVETFRPEIIFLDIGLPGMDGHEVARRLRQTHGIGQFRLFALSGYGNKQDKERSRQAGFDRHLVKPLDMDSVEELLATNC